MSLQQFFVAAGTNSASLPHTGGVRRNRTLPRGGAMRGPSTARFEAAHGEKRFFGMLATKRETTFFDSIGQFRTF